MLSAVITFLLVYAIYSLLNWIKKKKSSNPIVELHNKYSRYIWLYCGVSLVITLVIISLPEFSIKFHRPLYGQYEGWYFPNGHYSDLRLGDIREKSEYKKGLQREYHAFLMGREWEETESSKPMTPYTCLLRSLMTYDSNENSDTFGYGIFLQVYDLTEDIRLSDGDEERVYDSLIETQVGDSAFLERSSLYSPYKAVVSDTFCKLYIDREAKVFQKVITIYANGRAYALTFFMDKEVDGESIKETANKLDTQFTDLSKKLDVQSFHKWERAENLYNHYLKIQNWVYYGLYILIIALAILMAIKYLRNIGTINKKAAKLCKILSLMNIVAFSVLGLSLMLVFCGVQHEIILDIYQYRFESYINPDYVATSILCYGGWVVLLMIPVNRTFVSSYTLPQGTPPTQSEKGYIYWIVRPFVWITKIYRKIASTLQSEYNKQLRDLSNKG